MNIVGKVKLTCQITCSGCGRIIKPKDLNKEISKEEFIEMTTEGEGKEPQQIGCIHCRTINNVEVTGNFKTIVAKPWKPPGNGRPCVFPTY